MRIIRLLALVALTGCSFDADEDGFAAPEDCDDRDPERNPGVAEVCDGVDNDCNGEVDDGVGELAWTDADGDGFGEPGTEQFFCERPVDRADQGGDCDDTRARVHPRAVERCNGIDDDCDPETNEDGTAMFVEADGSNRSVTRWFREDRPGPLTLLDDGVVEFCPGSFQGAIEIRGATVELRGPSGDPITLRAADSIRPLTVDDGRVTVSDVILTGGAGQDGDVSGPGGNVLCEGDSQLTLTDVDLRNGYAEQGGQIAAVGGCDVVLEDVELDQSGALDAGGGLYLDGGEHALVDVVIQNSIAERGGGLHVSGGAAVDMNGVEFTRNRANREGGAIFLKRGDVVWSANDTRPSSATSNQSGGYSSVAEIRGGTLTVTDVDLAEDRDRENSGAEIHASSAGRIYHADDEATFTCTPLSCGTPVDSTLGSDEARFSARSGQIATLVDIDRGTTLDRFAVWMEPTGTCSADVVLYVTDDPATESSNWHEGHVVKIVPTEAGWYEARPPFPTSRRHTLALGVRWVCAEGSSMSVPTGTNATTDFPGGRVTRWATGPYSGGFDVLGTEGEAVWVEMETTTL